MHDTWKQVHSAGEAGPDPTWCGRRMATWNIINCEKSYKSALIFKGQFSEFGFVGLFIPWITLLLSEIGNVTQKAEAKWNSPTILVTGSSGKWNHGRKVTVAVCPMKTNLNHICNYRYYKMEDSCYYRKSLQEIFGIKLGIHGALETVPGKE